MTSSQQVAPAEVTGQQVVVEEADRLHSQYSDQWTAHITILRENQIIRSSTLPLT